MQCSALRYPQIEQYRELSFRQGSSPVQHGVPGELRSSIGRYYAKLTEVLREPLRNLFRQVIEFVSKNQVSDQRARLRVEVLKREHGCKADLGCRVDFFEQSLKACPLPFLRRIHGGSTWTGKFLNEDRTLSVRRQDLLEVCIDLLPLTDEEIGIDGPVVQRKHVGDPSKRTKGPRPIPNRKACEGHGHGESGIDGVNALPGGFDKLDVGRPLARVRSVETGVYLVAHPKNESTMVEKNGNDPIEKPTKPLDDGRVV